MEFIVNYKLILYADDIIIMVSHKGPNVIEAKLSAEIASDNNWPIENNTLPRQM